MVDKGFVAVFNIMDEELFEFEGIITISTCQQSIILP